MSSQAVQLLIDGSDETHAEVETSDRKAHDLVHFMDASHKEDGLLSPSQAADLLDVSHTRVVDLIELGKFTRYEFFGKRYVSCREILARRDSDLKAGRPPRTIVQRLKVAAKVVGKMETNQILADMTAPPKKKVRKK